MTDRYTVYASECLWCGHDLKEGVCLNGDCKDSRDEDEHIHSDVKSRDLCLDPWCPDYRKGFYVRQQRACWYCYFTADYEGDCDVDECPTHVSGFALPSMTRHTWRRGAMNPGPVIGWCEMGCSMRMGH